MMPVPFSMPRSAFVQRWLPLLLAALLIAVALRQGIKVTGDLRWPYDTDHFRDLAYTAKVLQGEWQADAFYQGETLWYNPLASWVVACISAATGVQAHIIHARAGAYLNVVGAVAFLVMVGVLFDWWVALAALFAFLFLHPGQERPFASATYSPWLYASGFAQGFFYLGLLVVRRAGRSGRPGAYLVAGAWVGLTFLAHTAPAVLLGTVLAAGAVARATSTDRQRGRRWAPCLRNLFLAMLAAIVVGLPLLWSLVGRYHLRVVNHAPAEWTYELLRPDQVGALARSSLSFSALFAVVGLVWLLRRWKTSKFEPTTAVWAVTNAALMAYGYGARLAVPLGIHAAVIPDFHFLFYWTALAAVWAGVGIVAVLRWAGTRGHPLVSPILFTTVALAGVVAVMPDYGRRFDFTIARDLAQSKGRDAARVQAFDWIRLGTDTSAVFLAPDDESQFMIGPAGRNVVAVDPSQSNPYVDWAMRASARAEMYASLAANDLARFCARAGDFHVTHVVLTEDEERRVALRDQRTLSPLFRSGDIRIWRVSGCAAR